MFNPQLVTTAPSQSVQRQSPWSPPIQRVPTPAESAEQNLVTPTAPTMTLVQDALESLRGSWFRSFWLSTFDRSLSAAIKSLEKFCETPAPHRGQESKWYHSCYLPLISDLKILAKQAQGMTWEHQGVVDLINKEVVQILQRDSIRSLTATWKEEIKHIIEHAPSDDVGGIGEEARQYEKRIALGLASGVGIGIFVTTGSLHLAAMSIGPVVAWRVRAFHNRMAIAWSRTFAEEKRQNIIDDSAVFVDLDRCQYLVQELRRRARDYDTDESDSDF